MAKPTSGRGDRRRDTLKILWGYCPAEIRAALRPILTDYLWLVPSWCQALYVRWDGKPEDRDSNASSGAQPEYRQAQLYIHPGWLAEIHAARVHAVIHELVHIPIAPMVKEHDDLADRLMDDAPRFRGYAKEQWRRAFEGAVQDIATAIGQLPGPFPAVPYVEVDDDDVGLAATNDADLVRVDPRYFTHLRELERLAIAAGDTTATAWEAKD